MPRINTLNSGHPLQLEMTADPTAARPFPTATAHDRLRLSKLNAAIRFIQQAIVHGIGGYNSATPNRCNIAFSALPRRRTFAQVWNDQDIWISFSGDPNPLNYGWSVETTKDLAISDGSFNRDWRFVAASLVHELAHINGAPGDDSPLAEDTLLSCGFAEMHLNIVGAIVRPHTPCLA